MSDTVPLLASRIKMVAPEIGIPLWSMMTPCIFPSWAIEKQVIKLITHKIPMCFRSHLIPG
jgi:hypothetical protein